MHLQEMTKNLICFCEQYYLVKTMGKLVKELTNTEHVVFKTVTTELTNNFRKQFLTISSQLTSWHKFPLFYKKKGWNMQILAQLEDMVHANFDHTGRTFCFNYNRHVC